jgi:hypothetical protein
LHDCRNAAGASVPTFVVVSQSVPPGDGITVVRARRADGGQYEKD